MVTRGRHTAADMHLGGRRGVEGMRGNRTSAVGVGDVGGGREGRAVMTVMVVMVEVKQFVRLYLAPRNRRLFHGDIHTAM